MGLIIFCYILGLAMLYLGLVQSVSQGLFFGIVLILIATLWLIKQFGGKNRNQ